MEHRHEPQRARNAARLRRPHLLRDLVQGAAEVADRARPRAGRRNRGRPRSSIRRDSWQRCCTRQMSRRSWRRVRPPLVPHRRRPASQPGIGFACARPQVQHHTRLPALCEGKARHDRASSRRACVCRYPRARARRAGAVALYRGVRCTRVVGAGCRRRACRFRSMRGSRTWSGWHESRRPGSCPASPATKTARFFARPGRRRPSRWRCRCTSAGLFTWTEWAHSACHVTSLQPRRPAIRIWAIPTITIGWARSKTGGVERRQLGDRAASPPAAWARAAHRTPHGRQIELRPRRLLRSTDCALASPLACCAGDAASAAFNSAALAARMCSRMALSAVSGLRSRMWRMTASCSRWAPLNRPGVYAALATSRCICPWISSAIRTSSALPLAR